MANNVSTGPNSRVSLTATSFEDMGLNTENTVIVYETEGGYKSWKPGRFVNPITATEIGKGYILIQKMAMDLSAFFAPPLAEIASFKYVLPVNGVVNI